MFGQPIDRFYKMSDVKLGKVTHSHSVYMTDQGIGEVSPGKDGHIHNVTVRTQLQLVDTQDPQTGEVVQVEQEVPVIGTNGRPELVIEHAEDGHTHNAVEFRFKAQTEKSMTKDEKVRETLDMYNSSKVLRENWIRNAQKEHQIYVGEQHWSSKAKNELFSKNQAAHTINEIKQIIDSISGVQRRNRTDLRYLPVENGDSILAEVLSKVVKNILDRNNFETEESETFLDTLISGLGYLHIFIKLNTSSLEPEIGIERFDYSDLLLGPHEKLNASDCEYAIKRKWLSKSQLMAMFPKSAKKIEEFSDFSTDVRTGQSVTYDDIDLNIGQFSTIRYAFKDFFQKDKEFVKLRLFELLKKFYRSVPVLFSLQDGWYLNGESFTASDLSQILKIQGISKVDKVFTTIKSYKVVGHELVEEGELLFDSLPIIPIYGTRTGDFVKGKIADGKDLQLQLNKLHSKINDIINKSSNYGYLFENEAFSELQKERFLKDINKPGFAIEVEDLTKIQLQQGIKTPHEILSLIPMISAKLKEVLGVRTTTEGDDLALLASNEAYFDHLSLSKQRLGQLLLQALKLYTPERIYRLLQDSRSLTQEGVQDPETGLAISPEKLSELWKQADLTQYDIKVSENIQSETSRQTALKEWTEIFGQLGQLLPPQVTLPFLLNLTDVFGKDEFLRSLGDFASQQVTTEKDTADKQVDMSQPDDIKRAEYIKQQQQLPQAVTEQVPPTQ